MKIVTYHSTEAPSSMAYMARIIAVKGMPPIMAAAATKEAAVAKMQAAWDSWVEKAQSMRSGKFARNVTAEDLITEHVGRFEPVPDESEGYPLLQGDTYWHHHESGSYFMLTDGDPHPAAGGDADGALCVEITKAQYDAATVSENDDLSTLFG